MKKPITIIFLLVFLLAAAPSLFAGITATPKTGTPEDAALAAALTGLLVTTNDFGDSFVRRFLDPEAENLSKTNIIGGLMGHPTSDPTIKSGVLPGFMIGGCAGVAAGLSDDVRFTLGGESVEFPLVAGVVGFNLYGGLNLGLWGLGFPNVDIILHGGGGSFGWKFDDYEISGSSYRGGILLRYHVINPISLLVVKFLGLSVGAGYAYQNVDFKLTRDSKDKYDVASENPLLTTATWRNKQTVGFEATNSMIPLQVQTGINLLWVLNLHVGLGYALAYGNTEVGYKARGTVSSTLSGNPASANLLIDYTGKEEAENTSYIFGGGEIKIFMFHIVAEGIWNFDKVAGFTVGMRFQL
jgi:hypothetical protein